MSADWSHYKSQRGSTRPRLIWSSFGEAGTWKTTFGLQGPGPIVVQSLDYGLEGVGAEEKAQKDVIEIEYDWNPTDDSTQEQAIELRDKFIADYRYALKHARTILWDKESQVKPLFDAAEWETGYKPEPREWGPLQQRYRALINEAKATDVNFGLIQGMKSPWSVGQKGLTKSKDRVRRGFAEIDELVHVNIEHYVEMLPGETPPFRIMFRTGKLRGPGARQWQYQEFPYVTFPEFGQLLFPESSDRDWM